jgi:hypothetical protein
MTHTVERLVVGDGGAAFVQACRYPSGAQVRCIAVLDLEDGLIRRVPVTTILRTHTNEPCSDRHHPRSR